MEESQPDYLVGGGGSIYLLEPQTDSAYEHLVQNVGDEAQWLGRALAVEHRYIQDLVEQLREAGWTVA